MRRKPVLAEEPWGDILHDCVCDIWSAGGGECSCHLVLEAHVDCFAKNITGQKVQNIVQQYTVSLDPFKCVS